VAAAASASAVVLSAASALLAACDRSGDEASESNALWAPGDAHELCLTSARSSAFTEGLDALANRGDGPVQVTDISWRHTRGLKLLGVSYIQRRSKDQFATFGTWRGFPPRGLGSAARSLDAAWQRRKPLAAATLPETDGRANYFIVIVGFSGAHGSAGPLRIHYTDGHGGQGVVDTKVTVSAQSRC
jgi:hypothetical protein